MVRSLKSEIRQTKPFVSAAEEAFLNLLRSASFLQQNFNRFLRFHRLTHTQYNVLRILRGAHPDTLPCGEVGDRMVTSEPDVTRLLDRLEHRGLVQRSREEEDRRVVRAGITASGMDLLGQLDEPVLDWLDRHLGHLPDAELQEMSRLLAVAREQVAAVPED